MFIAFKMLKIWSCFTCFLHAYSNIGAAITFCQQKILNQDTSHLTSPLLASYLVIGLDILNLISIC